MDFPVSYMSMKGALYSQATQFKISNDGYFTRGAVGKIHIPVSFGCHATKSRRKHGRDTASRDLDLWYFLPGEMFHIDTKVYPVKDTFNLYSMYINIYDIPHLIVTVTKLSSNIRHVLVVEYRLPKASLSRVTLSLSEIFGREISKMEPVNLPYSLSGVFAGKNQKPDVPSFRKFAEENNFNSEGALNLGAITLPFTVQRDRFARYDQRTLGNPWRHCKAGDSVMVDSTSLFIPTQNSCEIL